MLPQRRRNVAQHFAVDVELANAVDKGPRDRFLRLAVGIDQSDRPALSAGKSQYNALILSARQRRLKGCVERPAAAGERLLPNVAQ